METQSETPAQRAAKRPANKTGAEDAVICGPYIRHSDAGQFRQVMAVMAEAFDPEYGEGWNDSQTSSMLDMPNAALWLAININDKVVGFAITRQVADEIEIMLIAVTPQYQKNRIGNNIILEIIKYYKGMDIRYLFLEVRHNNKALNFYSHIGFKKIGERKNYYKGKNNKRYDAITLMRNLVDI